MTSQIGHNPALEWHQYVCYHFPSQIRRGVSGRMRLLGVLMLSIGLLLVSSLLIDRSSGEQTGFFQHIQDMRIRSGE
jgi:hypothetical protein